jgi:hypothetical protein
MSLKQWKQKTLYVFSMCKLGKGWPSINAYTERLLVETVIVDYKRRARYDN